ncbi:MAG TPA: hypothetical protein EYN79_03830 [Planctomycetes bacterium]|nr:hypothetical protein [Planctomycetota bacterium]HIN80182.1 hypothetical protein [Planctomycetota bacterium]
MITAIRWQGDLDGDLVLTVDGGEKVVDRPGDLIETMMAEEFASEDLLVSAATYGFCLVSKKIEEPLFVRQILRKVVPFLRSPAMESLPLYQALERFTSFVENSGEEGLALREAVLEEAHRLGLQR